MCCLITYTVTDLKEQILFQMTCNSQYPSQLHLYQFALPDLEIIATCLTPGKRSLLSQKYVWRLTEQLAQVGKNPSHQAARLVPRDPWQNPTTLTGEKMRRIKVCAAETQETSMSLDWKLIVQRAPHGEGDDDTVTIVTPLSSGTYWILWYLTLT